MAQKAGDKLKLVDSVLKLSTSSIKTYEQCPRKYYFTYISKPEIPAKDWSHLTLGNFVHEVLEFFHNMLKKDLTRDRKRLMTFACKAKEKEIGKEGQPKYNLTEDIRKDIKEILLAYLVYLDKKGVPNVESNEKKFNIKLDEDLLIRGVIDRVDIGDGDTPTRFHVVDYKTGKSKYLDEFQLLVYGIPLLEDHPEMNEYKATYLALKEDMKEISYVFTRTDVEKVKEKIRGIARQMREDSTWEPRPQFLCNYCDYEPVCDASPKKRTSAKSARGGEIEWL